jgi:hypothetical protein
MPQLKAYDPGKPVPPTPRIRAYVEALLERWPDIEFDGNEVKNEDRPWAVGPLMKDATRWFTSGWRKRRCAWTRMWWQWCLGVGCPAARA